MQPEPGIFAPVFAAGSIEFFPNISFKGSRNRSEPSFASFKLPGLATIDFESAPFVIYAASLAYLDGVEFCPIWLLLNVLVLAVLLLLPGSDCPAKTAFTGPFSRVGVPATMLAFTPTFILAVD